MGIQPSEARNLSLAEYQALLFHHNLRIDPEGTNEPVEAPSVEEFEEMDAHFADRFGEVMH